MSDMVDIADAVVATLIAANLSMVFSATREFDPVFELSEEGVVVTVVPRQVIVASSSRADTRHDYVIDVGVQKRLTPDGDERAELDGLVHLTQEIIDELRFKPQAGAARVGIDNVPLVDREHLTQYRQFTSVITMTYRKIRGQ